MSTESSPNAAFAETEKSAEPPLTPSSGNSTSPKASSILSSAKLINEASSNFRLFKDISTPSQRSTKMINQHPNTAPPFLRNPKDVSMATQISTNLVDIDLAIGALDLGFVSKDSNAISTAAVEGTPGVPSTDTDNPLTTQVIEESKPSAANTESNENEKAAADNVPLINETNQFNEFPPPPHHHQPFPPFFPINGFGQPLHGSFNPGEQHPPLNHPQPWAVKPGQPNFANGLNSNRLDSLNHTPPLPPPGMIPMRHFEFGLDGVTPPLPPHLHPEGFVNLPGLKNDNSVKGARNEDFTPPGVIPNMDGSFQSAHGLRNNQLWPPLNGSPQNFDDAFAMSPNGLGPNSNPRFYPNGSGNHHPGNNRHNNNNRGHGRRYMGQRKRGEDAARFANAKLEDFIGQIYSLCKDQHGCRFLQKQLDLDSKNATAIYLEIHPYIIDLMIDPFGNYLIQKLLENLESKERIELVQNASVEFVKISLDSHGTRALQKLVECINTQEEAKIIVASLKDDVVLLSRDLNGNHVIQKCLQRLTSSDSNFIFETAFDHCLEIAAHRHGCCVLQRCLDYGSEEQCKKLSIIISAHTKELSLDPYGNYVIQYVLGKNIDGDAIKKIVDAVKGEIVKFALHKFGSNVIEKCLKATKYGPDLIEELFVNEQDLVTLLNDSFGNYVLQTSLDVAKGKQFDKLSSILKPLLPQVRNTPHGRRISSRLQQTV